MAIEITRATTFADGKGGPYEVHMIDEVLVQKFQDGREHRVLVRRTLETPKGFSIVRRVAEYLIADPALPESQWIALRFETPPEDWPSVAP